MGGNNSMMENMLTYMWIWISIDRVLFSTHWKDETITLLKRVGGWGVGIYLTELEAQWQVQGWERSWVWWLRMNSIPLYFHLLGAFLGIFLASVPFSFYLQGPFLVFVRSQSPSSSTVSSCILLLVARLLGLAPKCSFCFFGPFFIWVVCWWSLGDI